MRTGATLQGAQRGIAGEVERKWATMPPGHSALAALSRLRPGWRPFSSQVKTWPAHPVLWSLDLNLPAIASFGMAYVRSTWIIAVDLRYFDYEHANGLNGPARFDAAGALGGLKVGAASFPPELVCNAGFSKSFIARLGYVYNQNPIRNEDSFFNLGSPLIYQHTLSAGCSIRTDEKSSLNLAYSYFLPQDVEGPIVSPVIGPVPGSSVRNSSAFTFSVSA